MIDTILGKNRYDFLEAMNVIGGAASPHKVRPSERPATADPVTRENLVPNGVPMRKATSQETLNVKDKSKSKAETASMSGSSPSTPKSTRRSSLAGRFLSAITD